MNLDSLAHQVVEDAGFVSQMTRVETVGKSVALLSAPLEFVLSLRIASSSAAEMTLFVLEAQQREGSDLRQVKGPLVALRLPSCPPHRQNREGPAPGPNQGRSGPSYCA